MLFLSPLPHQKFFYKSMGVLIVQVNMLILEFKYKLFNMSLISHVKLCK